VLFQLGEHRLGESRAAQQLGAVQAELGGFRVPPGPRSAAGPGGAGQADQRWAAPGWAAAANAARATATVAPPWSSAASCSRITRSGQVVVALPARTKCSRTGRPPPWPSRARHSPLPPTPARPPLIGLAQRPPGPAADRGPGVPEPAELRLDRTELLSRSGLAEPVLTELEQHGLIRDRGRALRRRRARRRPGRRPTRRVRHRAAPPARLPQPPPTARWGFFAQLVAPGGPAEHTRCPGPGRRDRPELTALSQQAARGAGAHRPCGKPWAGSGRPPLPRGPDPARRVSPV